MLNKSLAFSGPVFQNVIRFVCSYHCYILRCPSVRHNCTGFQGRICMCLVHGVTCAWASLASSCSMQRRIRSLSFSPSSLSLSSSSFFLLSSLIPSSSFSLWLFNNWRNSFAPSTGCGERHKSERTRDEWMQMKVMTGWRWTEMDHVHPGLEDGHQAKSRNTSG